MGKAFKEWIKFSSDGNENKAAYLLYTCVMGGDAEMVWQILRQTGDKTYGYETFLKAARSILNEHV